MPEHTFQLKRQRGLSLALIWLLLASCSPQDPDKVTHEARRGQLNVPTEIVVKQRTTTAVTGSDGKLFITIDDITRNQVMASLATDQNNQVLATRSMSPTDAVEFKFGDMTYTLTLIELDNELLGQDMATFVLSSATASGNSETAKIERLIAAVADLRDAKFIRNGTEYGAAEAADHLRTKWEAAKEQVATADQFIESIASQSSLSGEPYMIRLSDGKLLRADEFLRERLNEITE